MGLDLGEFTVVRVTADEIGTAERADTNVRPQTPASWPARSLAAKLAVLVVPSCFGPALLKNPARAISPLRSAKPSPKILNPSTSPDSLRTLSACRRARRPSQNDQQSLIAPSEPPSTPEYVCHRSSLLTWFSTEELAQYSLINNRSSRKQLQSTF